jgi:transposase
LQGADALLPRSKAHTVIADKAYDAHERVIAPLQAAGKELVIPLRSTSKEQRPCDSSLYKARHVIENFFAKLKSE